MKMEASRRDPRTQLVDGIQRLVPAYDGGDDLVGVCGPGEGLGVMVGLVEIAVDAAWRSTTERNTPRFSRRLVSVAKKVSTALSQEHEVGVKWKVKRGWRASQASTLGCLWAA